MSSYAHQRARRSTAARAAPGAAAWAALGAALLAAAAMPPESPPAGPFRPGEQLDYRVSWGPTLAAATATLRVREAPEFAGRATWRFEAVARTIEPLRYLYELDDRYVSWSDQEALRALQFDAHQSRQGRQESSTVRFQREHIPAPPGGPAVRVPRVSHDPLGALYLLRRRDWAGRQGMPALAGPGDPVYYGGKLYSLRTRPAGDPAEVRTPAGRFRAVPVEGRLYERDQEVRNTRFTVWVSTDAARLPVRIEAALPVGSLRAELTSVRTP